MSKNRMKRKRLGDQKKQEVKDVKRLWETLKKVKEDIKKKKTGKGKEKKIRRKEREKRTRNDINKKANI